ncbi:hypothetical protein ALQ90_200007 [Pseudomonas savastanoi pv. savastanoi]|nr:hypothetical protein ALQ90_200007 [Pseudomonas savastanoi pv. savastanoi]
MANVQFAAAALGDRIEISVQHIPREVWNRLANRAGRVLRVGLGYWPVGHMNRGFGNAVHVDQLRCMIAKTVEPRLQAGHVQRFATEDDFFQ